MVRIFCKNNATRKEFPEGTTLLEILSAFDFDKERPVLAAKVNNVVEGLKYRVFNNRDVEFLNYTSYIGRNVYGRSLCFLLSKAAHDLFPACKIVMRRPICKGYYCRLDKGDGTPLSTSDIEAIKTAMKDIVLKDIPFRRHEEQTDEVIRMFEALGYDDKVKLLRTSGDIYSYYYTLDGTPDYYYDALLPSTGYLKLWDLLPFHDGLLLRLPDRHNPEVLAPMVEQPKTFEVFNEESQWNRIMGLANVGDVNCACLDGGASDLIQISEALQERKIVRIAEEIERRHREGGVKLVLITGPTSSGKSTFCKRLSIQLKACGIQPVSFSTDDYFVNRVETPKLPDGSYDFDNFDTVDHDYLQKDVIRLLAGEEVEVPEYNFVTGLREFNGKRLKMEEGRILLVEGIHALNPALTNEIEEKFKFRIFINTITSLSLDDHNCIPTSDIRLLRRIVRDYDKGAFSAQETISAWPNVRRSEGKWIYPYQEQADVLFNSGYLIELAVMRTHAERVLNTVPKNCGEYSEALRLMKFLRYFITVPDKEVPMSSLIRGFIGGSSL